MQVISKPPPRPLAHSSITSHAAIPQRRPEADPSGHARALVESYGFRSALDFARNNALFTCREDYWPRVLAAMEEQARAEKMRRASF
jgi:hypothetical protein